MTADRICVGAGRFLAFCHPAPRSQRGVEGGVPEEGDRVSPRELGVQGGYRAQCAAALTDAGTIRKAALFLTRPTDPAIREAHVRASHGARPLAG